MPVSHWKIYLSGLVWLGLAACQAAAPPVEPARLVTPASQTAPAPAEPPSATPPPATLPPASAEPSATPRPAVATPAGPIRPELVWFYKPPAKDLMGTVAKRFGFFIMSQGDEAQRDILLALRAPRPVLQYLRFEAIHDPGSCSQRPRQNQVADEAGDFCRISAEHPEWFLLDSHGRRIVSTDEDLTYYLMDPGQPGWRAFWLERARQFQADPGWGGVFLDNVEMTLAFHEQDGTQLLAYPTEAAFRAAVLGFLAYLRREYFEPEGRLLYANLIARSRDEAGWPDYLAYLDGAMHEGWAIDWPTGYRSAAQWERHLALAEAAQALGKHILLISQGKESQKNLQRFAYASYLLINQGRASFRYANSALYREVWLYDTYDLDLGDPRGPRYQDGSAWQRDFENGWVRVDPEAHTAEIHINP